LWAAALAGTSALYGALLGGLGRWIAPSLPAVGSGALSPWCLAAVAGAGVAVAGLTKLPSVRLRLVAVAVGAAAPPPACFARTEGKSGSILLTGTSSRVPVLVGAWEETAA
jgi:hypothetical protein